MRCSTYENVDRTHVRLNSKLLKALDHCDFQCNFFAATALNSFLDAHLVIDKVTPYSRQYYLHVAWYELNIDKISFREEVEVPLLLLLLLLLKKVGSARLTESDIHPISPIDRKKRKRKIVEDYSRNRAA